MDNAIASSRFDDVNPILGRAQEMITVLAVNILIPLQPNAI